jgi:hypothetical protein
MAKYFVLFVIAIALSAIGGFFLGVAMGLTTQINDPLFSAPPAPSGATPFRHLMPRNHVVLL